MRKEIEGNANLEKWLLLRPKNNYLEGILTGYNISIQECFESLISTNNLPSQINSQISISSTTCFVAGSEIPIILYDKDKQYLVKHFGSYGLLSNYLLIEVYLNKYQKILLNDLKKTIREKSDIRLLFPTIKNARSIHILTRDINKKEDLFLKIKKGYEEKFIKIFTNLVFPEIDAISFLEILTFQGPKNSFYQLYIDNKKEYYYFLGGSSTQRKLIINNETINEEQIIQRLEKELEPFRYSFSRGSSRLLSNFSLLTHRNENLRELARASIQ